MSKTPKQGFLLGGLALLLALNGWLLFAVSDDKTLGLVIAVGWSLLALAYLASAVHLRRHLRRPTAPAAAE